MEDTCTCGRPKMVESSSDRGCRRLCGICIKCYCSLKFIMIGRSFKSVLKISSVNLILIIVFFNLFFAEASPVIRVRHHHNDHDKDLSKVPLCERVPEARSRRDVSNSMHLKDAENSTLCPHVVCVDKDVHRRPVHIYQVVCQQCGSACIERGDYRCTQLYNVMEVWYVQNRTGGHQERWRDGEGGHAHLMVQDKYRVKYGCVCAATHAKPPAPHAAIVEQQ